MLTSALIVLTATALGGLTLFALYDWVRPHGAIWLPGVMHGALGLAGFVLLLAGLGAGPARGVGMGAGQFGTIAAVMLGGGLLLGGVAFLARLRGRASPSLVIGIHATLAVGGLVMLAAYVAAPT